MGTVLRWWLCAALLLLGLFARPVQAQTSASLQGIQFVQAGDGIRMSGNISFSLSSAVQDTMSKGVPVFFVLETSTMRDRWYWTDANLDTSRRYIRVMYLPLVRKWRLNYSNEPFEGGVSKGILLNQTYDSLNGALQAMQRISSWKVMDSDDWDSGADYTVNVRFRLDVAQLQRTLQFGTSGQSDWNLSVNRRYRLNAASLGRTLN